MHPAFSVIFLTTLIGAGQGLFLALYTSEFYSVLGLLPVRDDPLFFGLGALLALVLLAGGLAASFFHLGHPERAWRSAARWRTSWLSREVIALPAFMGVVFVYGLLHLSGWNPPLAVLGDGFVIRLTLAVGAAGVLLCVLLFLSTGMIYACLRFLQEWATPLTVINFFLLGTASGFTLAAAYAAYAGQSSVRFFGTWALILLALAFIARGTALLRNARLRHKSTLQSAIGVRHARIRQLSQGAMGGSFNTREFFYGRPERVLRAAQWSFLGLAFALPAALLALGLAGQGRGWLAGAVAVQYVGLVIERWVFFAQARHPQNLYYQAA